jgi:hypothetical protein
MIGGLLRVYQMDHGVPCSEGYGLALEYPNSDYNKPQARAGHYIKVAETKQ